MPEDEHSDEQRLILAKWKQKVADQASSMIASHDFHAKYVQHFPGHAPATVADKHYVVPSQEQFDKAIHWLGRQLGLGRS